ncbi:hypothetical protein DFH08DRAFT_1028670 [Mycena albidolilacea]|uniref:Zn(2)-C6 fungal-type domain-containing protein n=1 Tax=Mycena albidolilacea TaxID=1033008 RepID=A0AAD7EHL4_9AGAR|nr:hypothetical protein DFH08DRAFT_1028670 [Mycena albidolilacea]
MKRGWEEQSCSAAGKQAENASDIFQIYSIECQPPPSMDLLRPSRNDDKLWNGTSLIYKPTALQMKIEAIMPTAPSSETDSQPENTKRASMPIPLNRRRTMIACNSCRRRKIRCITSEQPPTNPCTYCKRKGFNCEYVVVSSADRGSTSQDDLAASPPDVESWKPPRTSANFTSTPSSPSSPSNSRHHTQSRPGSTRSSPTFPPLRTRRRKACHRRTVDSTHSAPGPSYRSGLPPAALTNQLYDLQTANALEYLSKRASHSLPSILPASLPRPAEYFAEDVQMPDFDFSATDMDVWALEVDASHFRVDPTQSSNLGGDFSQTTPWLGSDTWRGSGK